MPELNFGKYLDLYRWFDWFPTEGGPIHWVLLGFFLIGTVAAAYGRYYLIQQRFREHRLLLKLSARALNITIWILVIGALLVGSRLAGIPYLAARFLLLFDLLALVGFAGYAVYYWKFKLPAKLVAYDQVRLKQQYMPRPKSRSGHVRARKRSKARRG